MTTPHSDVRELRDLFAERTAAVPDISLPDRISGVEHRVRTIRRRRAATGAAAGVLVLALLALVAPGLVGGRDQAAPPAKRHKVAHGLLPVYYDGGKVRAFGTFVTSQTRVRAITVVPTSYLLRVATSCDKDMPKTWMIAYEVNGHPAMAGSCGRGITASSAAWGQDESFWQGLGVHPGQPVTLTARVTKPTPGGEPGTGPRYDGPLDKDYRVALGLYQQVPYADYPLPERPKHLDAFEAFESEHGSVYAVWKASQLGANTTRSISFDLPRHGAVVNLASGAPGRFVVAVNGTTILDWSSYVWSDNGCGCADINPKDVAPYGLHLEAGDPITVTVTTSRFTAPRWQVTVGHARATD